MFDVTKLFYDEWWYDDMLYNEWWYDNMLYGECLHDEKFSKFMISYFIIMIHKHDYDVFKVQWLYDDDACQLINQLITKVKTVLYCPFSLCLPKGIKGDDFWRKVLMFLDLVAKTLYTVVDYWSSALHEVRTPWWESSIMKDNERWQNE